MTHQRHPRRFTIDGSDELEVRLATVCDATVAGVQQCLPPEHLEAIVLGGGYGRGQGGVLRTPAGDQAYNDLDFYVFLKTNLPFAERRWSRTLAKFAEQLSPAAGLHIEFKMDSLSRFRRRPISMFSYDLVAAHRVMHGPSDLFCDCREHLAADLLPLSEATRLLFNRCSGLLLARKLLRQGALAAAEADFVGRNLAKAQLALGDVVLAAAGQYHWNCLERHRRLLAGSFSGGPAPWLEHIRAHHDAGVEFKLHPRRAVDSMAEFERAHREVSGLALQLWLWLESRRLGATFESPLDYAGSRLDKCPESSRIKGLLLNLRTLGPGALLDRAVLRYPRNRLLNSLPLLLWNGELAKEPKLLRYIQDQLHSRATNWAEIVTAYQRIWTHYG